MLLYTFAVTPNNRKVVAFIKHYDLPVDLHQVDFARRETKQPEYLAIHPMGKVPALVDDDFTLWESNAILTYLATKFPATCGVPADARGRADVDRWLHWQSCHLTPAMGALKTAEEPDPASLEPLLAVLDGQLEGREFILGALSVADFAIAPYLLTRLGRKLDCSAWPALATWRERMAQMKGFVASRAGKPGRARPQG